MITYIATFFSHFGAIRFKKYCEKYGLEAQAMPVPRNLSSSCGTCVRFSAEDCIISGRNEDADENNVIFSGQGEHLLNISRCSGHLEEIEQIVRLDEDRYEIIYSVND